MAVTDTTYEKHVFPMMQLCSTQVLTDDYLRSALPNAKWTFELIRSAMGHNVLQLRGWLASRQHTQSVRYPADWWEALKARFAPRWALTRWPVRYTSITLDACAIWPKFPYPADWGREIVWVEAKPQLDWLEEPGYGAGV